MSEGDTISQLRMAASQSADLKEFEKLDALLSQIPKKAQHGLMKTCDLVLTCIDANSFYIALGTNVGITFLWSRTDQSMQRLRTASTNDVITRVRLHHGIDDQLAFSTASGELAVYSFPGAASVNKKQTQKFEVKDMHRHYVTCLEWSTNGMKLYSADKGGQIVTTEVDAYQGQCMSSVLLVEPTTEIVQLDYKHKILLVSTRQRNFIVRLDQKCQVVNIGTQDRKKPGPFGACLLPDVCKTDDAKLYAARPGCRLWLSDVHGVVTNTHIFSEPLSAAVQEIPLLSAGKLQIGQADFQFGTLKCFRGREIVTWSNYALVVLDPEANRVVARQGRLNGIVDVAVVDDTGEIFLLRKHAEARVIRIAATGESKIAKVEPLPATRDEKPEHKEEKGSPAHIFFKKLAQPLKHFDKTLLLNSKQEPELPAEMRTSMVNSPDLPPVVTLTSPELEGLRMFTGETPACEAGTVSGGTAGTVSGGTAGTVSGGTAGTVSGGTAGTFPGLPVLVCATSSADSSGALPSPALSSSLPETCPTGSGSSSSTEGQQVKGETSPLTLDTVDIGIVFSHRMKKHKKKKAKEGLQVPRPTDDDNVSIASISSQLSDDAASTISSNNTAKSTPVPSTPFSTPVLSTPSSTPVSSTPSNTPVPFPSSPSSKTPAASSSTLQRADDMLMLVDILLNPASHGHLAPSDATHCVTDGTISKSGSDNQDPSLNEHSLNTQEKPATLVPTVVDTSHNSVDKKDIFPEVIGKEEIHVEKKVIEKKPKNVSTQVRAEMAEKPTGTVTTDSLHIYEDNNEKTNLLSECDQHLIMAGELNVSKDSGQQKYIPDASAILENAMANLARSKVPTVDSHTPNPQPSTPSVKQAPATSRLNSQNSFQDIYSEIDAIESTDPFRKGYKRDRSVDDFYSLFSDTSPESPMSPHGRPQLPFQHHPPPSEAVSSTEMQDVAELRLANTWSEILTPANIYSLALSNSHVWFTDKSENIYYSSVGSSKGIQWRKASGQASQICVSPSGHIVWRLHRGVVHAGTKISARHPEGLKWVEAVRDVATISVDNDCAWFVMRNGDVMMQRRLSLERPCYKSQKVECPHRIRHIVARSGVVWAVTENLGLLVRTGVSAESPEGTAWELDTRDVPPYLFSHIALDNDNIGWAIDVLGQVWFCDGVTRDQPLGKRLWWQVPMSEYILHDVSTLDMIRGLAKKLDPKKLAYVLSTNRGGLVLAGSYGILLAMDFRNVLQICQGTVQGYHWLQAQPAQMSPSSAWKQVCASVSHLDWGLLWAQHTNGDVFTFKQARAEASVVPDCSDFCCISVGPTAAWALTSSGAVYVRIGMGPHCPRGTGWVELDITQLADAHLVHISCNSLYVWAVEAVGTVYQRIGAKPPSENNLSPAWLAIDTFAVIVFTKVHTGPLDWMVWAIDNGRLTYVRVGITENMPIGQEWVNVPGIQAVDLALTKTGVWALTPSGEIFFRYGIARDRPCGNYWKKIPGTFIKISASANDELWGINTEGQLMQCSMKYLGRHLDNSEALVPAAVNTGNSVSEDVDWEIV